MQALRVLAHHVEPAAHFCFPVDYSTKLMVMQDNFVEVHRKNTGRRGRPFQPDLLSVQEKPRDDRDDCHAQDDPGRGAALFGRRRFVGDIEVDVAALLGSGCLGAFLLFFQVLNQPKLSV